MGEPKQTTSAEVLKGEIDKYEGYLKMVNETLNQLDRETRKEQLAKESVERSLRQRRAALEALTSNG